MSRVFADVWDSPFAAGCGLVGRATPGLLDPLNEPLFPANTTANMKIQAVIDIMPMFRENAYATFNINALCVDELCKEVK